MNAESEMQTSDGLGGDPPSEVAERRADLQRVADGHGEEYSNDELLRLGIGYGIPGPLSDEQMRKEAAELIEEAAERSQCDDCGRVWFADELKEVADLAERLDPGGVVPSGECPACGALAYPVGHVYAVVVLVEAGSREEAFDRVSDGAGPEPTNAHFIGEPFEVERADEYETRGVADQLAAAARSPRCLFCNDPDGGATHCPHCGAYNRTEPLGQRTRAELRAELEQAGREFDEEEISAETYDQRKLEILEEAIDAPD